MDPSTLKHNHRIWLEQDITKVMINLLKEDKLAILEEAMNTNQLSDVNCRSILLKLTQAKAIDGCIINLTNLTEDKQPLN